MGKQGKIVGFILLAIFGVIISGWLVYRGGNSEPLSHREIATRVLAEHLKEKVRPHSALVISNPYTELKGRQAEVYAFQKAGVEGLRKGFGAGVELKTLFPKLKPAAAQNSSGVFVDPKTTTPLSFLIEENAFDDLIRQHSSSELVVSLIGLPLNLQKMDWWSRGGAPQFGLLLPDWRMVGDRDAVRKAFKSGKIAAAVVAKPGAATDNKVASKDYKAEFEQRFILVTMENVDTALPK